LAAIDKQEVPSQRDGVLLFVGTEIKPGERVAPDRLIVVKNGDQERKYRLLKEGDPVDAGQLIAMLDDRLPRDELAIKKGQVVLAEVDLASAERARDEARDRYLTQMKLRSSAGGPATSEEDLAGAKLIWYRNHCDAVSKKEAISLANLMVHQSQTILGLYEIRTTIPGVIKRIHKHPGEAVRNLEPVLEVRNLRRLRVEGLVGAQHLPHLREGQKAVIQPSQEQSPQQTFIGHLQDVTGVAVSKDSTLILSASADGTVRVWSRSARREQWMLKHPAPVRCVACTPPGSGANRCLVGGTNGSAWIWDLDKPGDSRLQELKGQHHGPVASVAFSPDGLACVTGSEDHEICLWDVATGKLRYRFPAGHLGAITALHFPLPPRVISAGRDNALRVWTLDERAARLETTLDHRSGDVPQLGVTSDGKHALFDQDNALHALSLPGGASEGALRRASGGNHFSTLALFSPDAGLVLTGGAFEGRLQLWRTPIGASPSCEVRQLISPDRSPTTCAAFAPNGSFLVAATRSRQVLVWPLPSTEEMQRACPVTISLVEQAVESSARQVRVWAELPNPDGRLVPGTTVTMTIYPGE
jgi:WD40 repeat protein